MSDRTVPRIVPRGPRLGWLTRPDAYGVAMFLILATLLLRVTVAPGDSVAVFVSLALSGGTLLFILWTSRARPATLRISGLIVLAACAGAGLGLTIFGGAASQGAASLVGLLLAFVSPLVILRRIVLSATITFELVLGALCIYLLIGLAYSYFFPLVAAIEGQPFFVQTQHATPADYIYFSYTTLATIGYGDYTAASNLGRMVAVSEGLLGQLYLVSAVALLVGNIGRTITHRGDASRDAHGLATEMGNPEEKRGSEEPHGVGERRGSS